MAAPAASRDLRRRRWEHRTSEVAQAGAGQPGLHPRCHSRRDLEGILTRKQADRTCLGAALRPVDVLDVSGTRMR